ncbi:MAG: hypothetical protein AAFW89_01735 [Bacteroidota bacterium]
MANVQTKVEEKRKELEAELDRIQSGIDTTIEDAKSEVVESLQPREIIKRYPLPLVGAALVLGLLAGKKGSDRSKRSGTSLSGIIGDELKKYAARKIIGGITSVADDLTSRNNPTHED